MSIKIIKESRWMPVFKTGLHTDSQNRQRTWTTDDIDAIIKKSDPSINDAPAVFSHPQKAAPRYGTVSGIKRIGDQLWLKFKNVPYAFADAVNKGLYPKISIALDKELRLLHVGFLGAEPPAIEGLPAAEFSALGAEGCSVDFDLPADHKFAGWEITTIAKIFQRLRDFIIEKDGVEKGDAVISQYDIESIGDAPDYEQVKPQENESVPFTNNKTPEETVSTELLEKENAQLKAKIAKMDADRVRDQHALFCASLVDAGKLKPADKDKVVELLCVLQTVAAEIQFSADRKESAVDVFKKLLIDLPVQLQKEIATKQNAAGSINGQQEFSAPDAAIDQDRLALYNQAMQLVQQENIPYNVAVKRVLQGK